MPEEKPKHTPETLADKKRWVLCYSNASARSIVLDHLETRLEGWIRSGVLTVIELKTEEKGFNYLYPIQVRMTESTTTRERIRIWNDAIEGARILTTDLLLEVRMYAR